MITFTVFSDKGGRDINEDAIGHAEKGNAHCFVLCDGLGGHGLGDVASKIVTDSVLEGFVSCRENDLKKIKKLFDDAQKDLLKEQEKRFAKKEMKTTATILVIDRNVYFYGHIGDSRMYSFENNKIMFRTLDHSVPQMLVLAKQINENEIRNHSDRNRLLRVMGNEWDEDSYEIGPRRKIKKNQSFLLCSDGFWECIEETEMTHTLEEAANPDDWMKKMLHIIENNHYKKKEEMDNYSAIAVWNRE